MATKIQAQARSRLDSRFDDAAASGELATPHKGWIRAIRDALGMSRRQMAVRQGVSEQTIVDLERSEQHGTIKLDSLRRAASTLDCDLVYYLRPRTSLSEMVSSQARRKAEEHLDKVAHHSALEDQSVSAEDTASQLEDLAEDFIDRRGLWAESAR